MSSLSRRLARLRDKKTPPTRPTGSGFDLSPYRLAIGTPMAGDTCTATYCRSIVRSIAFCLGSGLRVSHEIASYSILPLSRQILAQEAMKAGSTHLLMIDADMEFAPEVPLVMLMRQKPIVAANCMARRHPYYLTARDFENREVSTTAESTGIERVARAGTGVMLVSLDVLRRIPLPWFEFPWNAEKASFTGEDFAFCDKATKAGFEIVIDHDASKQISHVGQFGYTPLMRNGFLEAQAFAAEHAEAAKKESA